MNAGIDWASYPYPSRRVPVIARNVVATSQPLAVQAGVQAFREGGNAMDAALSAAITLTVVEPCSNGLGSDAFAMVWDGQSLHGLNGSGKTASGLDLDRFRDREAITTGGTSVTVPGCVDAWVRLSDRFGNLPFAKLFEPAIHYAEAGFAITPTIQGQWQEAEYEYSEFPEFVRFYYPQGRSPHVGEVFKPTAMAATLRGIAESRGEVFYRGDIARSSVRCLAGYDSDLTLEDFGAHESLSVEPVRMAFAGIDLYELPPNGQGVAALIALGILKRRGIEQYPVDSIDSVHLQVEAMKAAFLVTHAEVADAESMRISVDELLSDSNLDALADGIRLSEASTIGQKRVGDGGTVYLTSADQDGMMVSFIQSNYWGFGSGIVDPNTGVSFQNRAAGFTLSPGHPNCVAAGKRPFHTIIPGFVMRDGQPLMSFGVMGAHMQAQGHVQMMVRIFCHGQNPQTASDGPRWYVDHDYNVVLEQGFDRQLLEGLASRGHVIGGAMTTGGAQLIYRLDNGYYGAASDHRKDGHAAGF